MDNRQYVVDVLNEKKLKFDIVETPVYKIVVECCDNCISTVEIYPDIFNKRFDLLDEKEYLTLFTYYDELGSRKHPEFHTIVEAYHNLVAYGAPRIDGTHIRNLNLSKRTYNGLTRDDIYYIEDAISIIESGAIFSIRNLGKKSITELCDKLNTFGYKVKNPFEEKKRSSETEEIINELATKMNVSSDEVSSMLNDLNIAGFRKKRVKEINE